MLAGCYDSTEDLIGDKGTRVIRFDSLITKDSSVFYWFRDKDDLDYLCRVRLASELRAPCKRENRLPVKFERTSFGNYIVQVGQLQQDKSYKYHFALWLRSEPGNTSSIHTCVMWLGDGLTKSNPFSVVRLTWDSDPTFRNLKRELNAIVDDDNPSITRIQLLKVVELYERLLFSPFGRDKEAVQCLNDRLFISGESIVLERDNRHLRDYE